ncbi:hypothetical protein ACFL17_00545, partial [Pseudomonadota bacterium]
MTLRTFYSLDSLIEHANKKLDDIDVVSMDIFDTLFIRRIHDPDIVKFPVARYISARAKELDISTTWQKVLQTRNVIEAKHRKNNGQSFPDFEARYDDYMGEALEQLFGDKMPVDLLKDVATYEISIEDAVIVVRQPLFNWIKELHQQNKRIFLVSDIYLPAYYLKQLVQLKGLEPYVEDVISSADTFNAKASGTAFPLMENKYNLKKDHWLHLGDNAHSDGRQPHAFGIDALILRDIREKQRLGISRSIAYYATQNIYWRGRNLQQVMIPLEAQNQERDPLYVDGYNFFGILIANFIHKLIEHCKEKNITHVYFCSREGWIFQKCWNQMVDQFYPTGDAPQTSYLYVSRLALATAACGTVGLPLINARAALLPGENRDFRDVCRVFGLDIKPLLPYLEAADLSEDDDLDPAPPGERIDKRQNLAMLLGDDNFQDEVKRQGRPARDALEAYLKSENFFDQSDIALVDIGWLGTIQHFLSNAIAHREDIPNVHGFVLAATRLMAYKNSYTNYTEGLLYDNYRLDIPASTLLCMKDILEEICRAPHPTLLSYTLIDSEVKLNFRSKDDAVGQEEQRQNEYYTPLHAAAQQRPRIRQQRCRL